MFAIGVACVVTLVSTQGVVASMTADATALEAKVATAETSAVDAESKASDVETQATSGTLADDIESARKVGEEMLACQVAYGTEDASSDAFQATVAKADALLSEDDKDKRTPWIVLDGVTWTFAGPYSAGANGIDMMWIAHVADDGTDGGGIVAYATADYDTTTGLLENVVYHQTALGEARLYSSEGALEERDALMAEVESISDGTTAPTVSEDEATSLAETRAQLKEQESGASE